jgi:histone deacetylase 1/2
MRRVAYLYNEDITNYHFSKDHPMKTKRIAMANSLIMNYDLYSQMDHYVSKYSNRPELELFHDPDYVSYLEQWVLGKK